MTINGKKSIAETKKVFERWSGKKLTDKEAAQMKDWLVKYFNLLIEIDRKNKLKKKVVKSE